MRVRPDCRAAAAAIFSQRPRRRSPLSPANRGTVCDETNGATQATPNSVDFSTTQSILSPLPTAWARVTARGDSRSGRYDRTTVMAATPSP